MTGKVGRIPGRCQFSRRHRIDAEFRLPDRAADRYPDPLEASILIESVGFGGAGVGRLPDGRVCFVPYTLPGERVIVRTVTEKKSYVEGEVVRLAEVSPKRVRPRCPVFGTCGGCAYQHADYDLQLEIKTSQVVDLLRRVGGFSSIDVRPSMASPEQWEYRNRISVHVADGKTGFHHRKSRHLVPVDHCPIANPEVNEQLAVLARRPPRGKSRFTLRSRTDHHGFRQVNEGAAGVLLEVVAGMFTGPEDHLVDAYCGAGFFSKALLPRFSKVTGIEWSEPAIAAARSTAGESELYVQGAVEYHLASVLEGYAPAQTALLVDPPSEGLAPDVANAILSRPPGTLVYVSCDPATLARDLKKLAGPYQIDHVQPIDMFPQTAEIEVAAVCRLRV